MAQECGALTAAPNFVNAQIERVRWELTSEEDGRSWGMAAIPARGTKSARPTMISTFDAPNNQPVSFGHGPVNSLRGSRVQ